MLQRRCSNNTDLLGRGWYRQQQLIFLQMVLLCLVATSSIANPVSSPEIASKTIKISSAGAPQQTNLKTSGQDPQLNSLSAYAAANGYDSLSEENFKPSYKLPDMETNFTPMQSIGSVGGSGPLPSPTPVLMQYLPQQTGGEGSVQYLQLIPTRPLIVPISPYLTAQQGTQFQQALTIDNTIADYPNRPAPSILTTHPNSNSFPAGTAHLVSVSSSHLPYGLQTYANAIQPYRSGFRFNREIKDKNIPPGLNLNLQEYVPGSHDMPHFTARGRP